MSSIMSLTLSDCANEFLLPPTQKKSRKCCNIGHLFNKLFDYCTILITVLDVSTDIWVIYQFWMKDRLTFFIIGVIILGIAQLSYAFIFLMRCSKSDIDANWSSCIEFVRIFIIGLLLGPFTSFIIYLADDTESWLYKRCKNSKYWSIDDVFMRSSEADSPLKKWMISKLSKHIGFFLESVVEALPQAILQMIAIVYFNEMNNYISIISILLSMLSVITKSLVLAQGIEIKTYIFIWLCIITDFYGIFFVISWVFYHSNNTNMSIQFLNTFTFIGELYIWKLIICITPITFGIATGYYGYGVFAGFYEFILSGSAPSFCKGVCFFIGMFLLATFGYILGFCFLFMGLEIMTFIIFAVVLHMFSTDRFGDFDNVKQNDLLNWMLNWIFESNTKEYKNQKLAKIYAINYGISKHYRYNKRLSRYITQQKDNIISSSFYSIRNNCDDSHTATICPQICGFYFGAMCHIRGEFNFNKCKHVLLFFCAEIITLLAIFIVFPLYALSKLFQIFYPFFILFYIYYFNLWNDVDTFQYVMLSIYIGLELIIFLLFICYIGRIHYYLWHIAPGISYVTLGKCTGQDFKDCVHTFYNELQLTPLIEKWCCQLMGPDIGAIIVDYYKNIEIHEYYIESIYL